MEFIGSLFGFLAPVLSIVELLYSLEITTALFSLLLVIVNDMALNLLAGIYIFVDSLFIL